MSFGRADRALDAQGPPDQALDPRDVLAEVGVASQGGLAQGATSKDVWQAGKSVATIDTIEPAAEVVKRFGTAL